MTLELWMLFWSCVLGIAHLSASSFAYKGQEGNKYTIGPRDEHRPPMGLAGRFVRAQQNFNETFAIFAALILMVHVLNENGMWSAWGAQVYFWARVGYLPAYAMGLPWVRTFIWQLSMVGLLGVGADLFV
ncbi:MAPEG family protein [Parvibaculaceae bacterium PLY_AMNH_Bact1]|nr:MAPEG family protein [Parvibaculaceae bacterium PLY_AMNH_Bact1]